MNGGQGARNLLALYRAWGTEESFNPGEKVIIGTLITCMDEHTFEAYPGEEWLARKAHMTKKPLRAHIRALVEREELEIVKKHGKGGCTVYKVKWAEKKFAEIEAAKMPAQAAKKASKQYRPFPHHDNSYSEDLPDLPTTSVDEQFYYSTQEQSNDNTQWYEEVAYDIEGEGAISPLPSLTEEEKEQSRNHIREVLFSTNKYLKLPSIFKNRAIDHWYTEKEAEKLYLEYQEYMKR